MGLLATMWDSVALEQHSNFWPSVVWLYLALIQHQDLTLSFVKKGFSNFRFKAYLNWVGELKLQWFFFFLSVGRYPFHSWTPGHVAHWQGKCYMDKWIAWRLPLSALRNYERNREDKEEARSEARVLARTDGRRCSGRWVDRWPWAIPPGPGCTSDPASPMCLWWDIVLRAQTYNRGLWSKQSGS